MCKKDCNGNKYLNRQNFKEEQKLNKKSILFRNEKKIISQQ